MQVTIFYLFFLNFDINKLIWKMLNQKRVVIQKSIASIWQCSIFYKRNCLQKVTVSADIIWDGHGVM